MKIFILLIIIVLTLYSSECKIKTYIPVNAKENLINLYIETYEILPDFSKPYYFGALIEHESCVRLCGNGYWAKRCWSPKSQLKTDREEGAGVFQLTRTYRKNGTIRFDTILNLKQKYPKQLYELSWDNVYDRLDLQIKAGLLLWRDNYKILNNDISEYNKMCFSDAAFNMGYRAILNRRSYCKLQKGCNPNVWKDNVENICLKTKKIYNRRICDIGTNHVNNTLLRLDKYEDNFYNHIFEIIEK